MSCTLFPNADQAKFSKSRLIGQLGFTPLWKRRNRAGYLRLRVSAPSTSERGLGGLQDGSSATEDDDKEKKAPRISVPNETESELEVVRNRNGSSVVEEDNKMNNGLVFNTETDGSGSVIGFHLAPSPGMSMASKTSIFQYLNSVTVNFNVYLLLHLFFPLFF